jgi:hypothetical protein
MLQYFLFLKPESEFSTLSLHEPTPEERDQAEKLKNEGTYHRKASLQ